MEEKEVDLVDNEKYMKWAITVPGIAVTEGGLNELDPNEYFDAKTAFAALPLNLRRQWLTSEGAIPFILEKNACLCVECPEHTGVKKKARLKGLLYGIY